MTTASTATPEAKTEADKAPEFATEELLAIFDQILFEGTYKEKVTIRGKLEVEFQALTAKDLSEISKEIDAASFNLVSTLQEQRSLLTLQKGMSGYNHRDISGLTSEKKAEFISKLPAAVVGALSDAQYKFNRKVGAACSEGESNF